MLLELNRDEYRALVELLKRRLDEIGPEERRSDTRHYKELLHDEQVLLERLRGRLEEHQSELEASAGSAG